VEELLILGAEASRALEVAVPTYLELEEPIQKSFFYSADLNEVFCGGRESFNANGTFVFT